jgi:hypothetical protein
MDSTIPKTVNSDEGDDKKLQFSTAYTDEEEVSVYFRTILYNGGEEQNYVKKQLYIDGWAVSIHDIRLILATVYQYIRDSTDAFYATSTTHSGINCNTKTIRYEGVDTICVQISLYPEHHSTDITFTLDEFLSIVAFISDNIQKQLHERPSYP